MILLFGFIAISEVSKKSQIKLAESTAVPATAPDRETVIFVGVLPDGRYLVEEESKVISNPNILVQYIDSKRNQLNNQNIRMRVRVRANHDAPVRYAFTVVDICQRMKIPVGLDVLRKGNR